jgi:hypothetical protein
MRRLLLALLVSFLLPYPLPSAYADEEQFTLNGKVLDSSRSPLPGARVTAVPDHQGPTASTVSDSAGNFTLLLESDGYTIKVSAAGFLEVTRRINAVGDPGDRREFVLQVAGVQESVSVSARADYGTTIVSSATRIRRHFETCRKQSASCPRNSSKIN